MAEVTFPNVDESTMMLRQEYPNQAVVRAAYSGKQHVTNAGGQPYWVGSITLRGCEDDEYDYISAVNAFLASLRGNVNTFRIPIYASGYYDRQGTLVGSTLRFASASSTERPDQMTITGAAEGIATGDYLTINERLFIVTERLSGSVMSVSPFATLLTGSGTPVIEYQSPTIHVRPEGRLPDTTNAGNGLMRPWKINFQEVVP